MLDQRFLENRRFNAIYTQDSVSEAINEIIDIIRSTLDEIKITILFKDEYLQDVYPLVQFDKRRL